MVESVSYTHVYVDKRQVDGIDTPDVGDVPLVADFSSSIASEPVDVSKLSLIHI